MVEKKAIIAGITGQDGSYMAEKLMKMGFNVYGLTRGNLIVKNIRNLMHLEENIKLIQTNYSQEEINDIVSDIRPQQIYNFTGQSYVSKSWDIVEETITSQGVISSRFLVGIEKIDNSIRFLNASSAEIFEIDSKGMILDSSNISPYNPYGCAQSLGHLMVKAYREKRKIYAVNAVLFPHESPRRSPNFAFQKIISTAVKIRNNSASELFVGNLNVERDWGYAPFYVDAMCNMMNLKQPEDFLLCTGKSTSIKNVIKIVFEFLNLDWKEYVKVNQRLLRFYEPEKIFGDPNKAQKILNLNNTFDIKEIIKNIVNFELDNFNNHITSFDNEKFL